MTSFAPLPRIDFANAETLFEPSGDGAGHWVGAPSVHRYDGTTYLAIRWRSPDERGHTVTIHERRSRNRFDAVFQVTADELGVESVERPSLVTDPRDGSLRLYLPVDHGENDWSIQTFDGTTSPEAFDHETARPVLAPQSGGTDRETVKDPYVVTVGRRYFLYYAGHDGRSEQAHLATSTDGESWTRSSANPTIPRRGWHDHHTRISCVVPARRCAAWHVFYEGSGADDHGRTWNLRTGTALSFDLETVVDTSPDGPWLEAPVDDRRAAREQFATCRYLDLLDHGDEWEVFAEVARRDGSFALRRTFADVPG